MADLIDTDGWYVWDRTEVGTWPSMWPPVRYRAESETRMALRAEAPERTRNMLGQVHGAFLAGLAEHVCGVFLHSRSIANATVSLALDYPAGAIVGQPLTGFVEMLRETGRLQFVRVELGQGEDVVIHGIATLRKFAS